MCWVPLVGYPLLRYAFRSKAIEEHRAALGQTVLLDNVAEVTGYVIGANAPKPGRATKVFAALGNVSGFYNFNNLAELKAAKWKVTKGKNPPKASNGKLSSIVFVEINGIAYAWHSAKVTGATQPPVGEIGVTPVEPTTPNLVFGASFPKPPRGKIALADGSIYSTYASPTAVIPETSGWLVNYDKSHYTLEDLKSYASAAPAAT